MSAFLTWWYLRGKDTAVNGGTFFEERITVREFPFAAVNVGQYVVLVILCPVGTGSCENISYWGHNDPASSRGTFHQVALRIITTLLHWVPEGGVDS